MRLCGDFLVIELAQLPIWPVQGYPSLQSLPYVSSGHGNLMLPPMAMRRCSRWRGAVGGFPAPQSGIRGGRPARPCARAATLCRGVASIGSCGRYIPRAVGLVGGETGEEMSGGGRSWARWRRPDVREVAETLAESPRKRRVSPCEFGEVPLHPPSHEKEANRL